MPSRYRGFPFVAVGFLLLANPLYLDSLLCPRCGWDLDPVYFAVATAVGVTCVLSGLLTATLPVEVRDRYYLVLGIPGAAVAGVALNEALLLPLFVPSETGLFGLQLFVAALAGSAFLVGVGIARGSASLVAEAVVLPLLFAVLVGDPARVVLSLLVVTVSVDVGVPFAGVLAFATAAVAGLSYGLPSDRPAPDRSTGTAPDPE